jgi:hypothetical protein
LPGGLVAVGAGATPITESGGGTSWSTLPTPDGKSGPAGGANKTGGAEIRWSDYFWATVEVAKPIVAELVADSLTHKSKIETIFRGVEIYQEQRATDMNPFEAGVITALYGVGEGVGYNQIEQLVQGKDIRGNELTSTEKWSSVLIGSGSVFVTVFGGPVIKNRLGIGGGAKKTIPDAAKAPTPLVPERGPSPFILGTRGERLTLPSNSITASEAAEIQAIANKYNTTIDVVGSRAAGNGRNIDTNLPVGKQIRGGPPTRSDIDFRIDAAHPKAADIIRDLQGVGNGAGTAGSKWTTNPTTPGGRPTEPPLIRFNPKSP